MTSPLAHHSSLDQCQLRHLITSPHRIEQSQLLEMLTLTALPIYVRTEVIVLITELQECVLLSLEHTNIFN